MRRDDAYLLDILIAARKALKFMEGVTWEAFQQSDLHQNAVAHLLEIELPVWFRKRPATRIQISRGSR